MSRLTQKSSWSPAPTCTGSSRTPLQMGHIRSSSTSPWKRATSYPISHHRCQNPRKRRREGEKKDEQCEDIWTSIFTVLFLQSQLKVTLFCWLPYLPTDLIRLHSKPGIHRQIPNPLRAGCGTVGREREHTIWLSPTSAHWIAPVFPAC